MKAMILAAGKGTRVRPLTSVMPKPMIPLVRKPVMQSIVEHLVHHEFTDIFVNTSYLSSSIEEYFRDGDQFGANIAYSYEGVLKDGQFIDQPLGSAGGMRKIQDFCQFFDGTFAVLCGDALIDVDLSEAVRIHRQKNSIATIITKDVPREDVTKYGVVVADESGRVLRFQEKPKVEDAASTQANTGIYIFEPEIFNYIPTGVEYDIGSQLFPSLIDAGAPLYCVSLPFQWVDIGSVIDFWHATRLVLEGKVNGYRLPGNEIFPAIRTGMGIRANWDKISLKGPVYIGSGTSIGDGALIEGPTMIGPNCVIEAGAQIRQSIIGDYTRVSDIASLEQRIVFAGKIIDPYGGAIDIQEADIGWLLDDARKEQHVNPLQSTLQSLGTARAGV